MSCKNEVTLPRGLALVPIIGLLVFMVPTIYGFVTHEKNGWLCFGIFLCLQLFFLWFLLTVLFWRLTYDDEKITKRSFCGIRRVYPYDKLTACTAGKKDKTLYFGRRRVFIDHWAVGGTILFQYAKNRYSIRHAGNRLPNKKDIFCNKLENKGEFLFVLILVYLLCAFFPFVVFRTEYHPDYTADQLKYETDAFDRYRYDGDCLQLFRPELNQPYCIDDAKENVQNLSQLLDEINANTPETDFTKPIQASTSNIFQYQIGFLFFSDDSGGHFDIYALTSADGSNIFIRPEQMNRYDRQQLYVHLLISLVPLSAWTLYTAAFIYVVRHHERFSKNFVRLFVKDGYLINNNPASKRKK